MTMNVLCCAEPLPADEVEICLVDALKRHCVFDAKSQAYEQFSLGFNNELSQIKLRPGESPPTY